MKTPASRSRAKSQGKPFKPSPVIKLTGYRTWSLHVAAFARYVQDDIDLQHHQAYVEWARSEHVLAGDLPYLFNLALQEYGLRRAQAALDEEAPRHLFALDVEDLLEFTSEDIHAAWAIPRQCCGSIEVAAELYALYRVLNGDDELYAGVSAYLDHPEVVAIFAPPEFEEQTVQKGRSLSDAAHDPVPPAEAEPVPGETLSLADVRELTIEGLKAAWANRPESFSSLEAAAEALSILRSLNSPNTERPSFQHMMQHQLVQDMEDSLPRELQLAMPSPTIELELLRADRRTVRTQLSVIRPGQGNFRATMLERYGGECCITGCRVDALLEAAHILPYRGDQSDDPTNGLLLRVDLHRLFDAHLVSIHPATLTVEVATALDDDGYQALHGKRLFAFSPKPRILFLEAHFSTFNAQRGTGALRPK
ncbi:HNH endonuclease [Pseudomonas baetica]|uniref:HNH endonuclease n=1 Tax=Pseudomonas baetica TaxID=674054 RepID=UPI0024055FDB|nr:HNH endonuclease [Pseudomonas baetica]MDF9778871.1 hypothetical protein [Pseudomonas baetica]